MAIPSRYLVLVNLLLLGLAAYWGASTVTTAIAAKLTPLPPVHLTAAPPPLAQSASRPISYYAAIYHRDIFNSTKPAAPAPPPAPVKTKLNLKLWGVAIHYGKQPSYAIIEDQGNRKQDLYRTGDTVPGPAKVVSIEWDKVTLERDGKKEFLELAPDAANAAHSPRSYGRRGFRPVSTGGIERLGNDQYAIDRSEVDTALANMNQLFTQIRAVPHFEGGQATGFRVFAIRSGSLFDKIGLKNGDIIKQINGVDLNDPARAMALFQELRNERNITVQITRNREDRTLSYQLR